MESKPQKIIIILAILMLVGISGCSERTDTPAMVLPEGATKSITSEDNSSLVYGGQALLPTLLPTTDTGGYMKVIRMYDTAENKVCYVTYVGIDCETRTVE